jgi:PAS domain S-box-containing protein
MAQSLAACMRRSCHPRFDLMPEYHERYGGHVCTSGGGIVAVTEIDYQRLFEIVPCAMAVLSPDLTVLDVNDEYLTAAGRKREELVGHSPFDLFPGRPDPADSGPRDLRASLESVLSSGERDVVSLTRYDVEDMGRPGVFEERYWNVVSTPLLSDSGRVMMILLLFHEATSIISQMRAERDRQG